MILKMLTPDWFRLNGPKHISFIFPHISFIFLISSYFEQKAVIGQNFSTEDRDWLEFSIEACDCSEFFIEACDWSELKTVTS